MPELPEVETVARTLYPLVHNAVLESAKILRPSSLHAASIPPDSLCGCRIGTVRRRGKLLLLELDATNAHNAAVRGMPDLVLAVHLRMTGRLTVRSGQEQPGPHTRCVFALRTPNGAAAQLFFDDIRAFGVVLAATPAILQQWSFWRELGPEPLDLDENGFAACLAGRKGALKAALLDQRVIAGIGNIYADESLFAARLDPRRRADTLTAKQRGGLLRSLKAVLWQSIAECGSSIRDYRDANGNVGAFQNSFAVYGRGGLPCRICGRPLGKIRVAGRGTVFCPRCQK